MRALSRLWLGVGTAGAAFVAAVAFWIYLALGSPAFLAEPPSAGASPSQSAPTSAAAMPADPPGKGHDRNELALGAVQLSKELERHPQDANGWQLLARTY